MKLPPFQFCHYCGNEYADKTYPFRCTTCENSVYLNPLPVVIVAVPIYKKSDSTAITKEGFSYHRQIGYLSVIRNIEPGKGKRAFPGGYVEKKEAWDEAGIREVFEETGITLQYVIFDHIASVDGFLCIFCTSNPVFDTEVNWKFENRETMSLVLTEDEDEEMAFPVQSKFLQGLPFGRAIAT